MTVPGTISRTLRLVMETCRTPLALPHQVDELAMGSKVDAPLGSGQRAFMIYVC